MRNKLSINIKIYIVAIICFIVLITIALFIRKPIVKQDKVRNWEDILSTGSLNVVSESSNIGINKEGENISGFQYEILKKFADKTGLELNIFLNNNLQECIDGLNADHYDLIAKLIPTITDYTDSLLFTVPLLVSRQMLIQQINEEENQPCITKQYQLAGDSVFIPLGSPHKMRLMHLADEIADTIYIIEMEDKTPQQLIALVADGKIRNTICHEQLSRKAVKLYSNIDASLPVSFDQPYAWMVNKNSKELLEELNTFLSGFIGSNEYWSIYRKYY